MEKVELKKYIQESNEHKEILFNSLYNSLRTI